MITFASRSGLCPPPSDCAPPMSQALLSASRENDLSITLQTREILARRAVRDTSVDTFLSYDLS